MLVAMSNENSIVDIDKMYSIICNKDKLVIYVQADTEKIYIGSVDTVKELTYLLYINKDNMSSIQKVNYIIKIIKNIEILELATEMRHVNGLIDYVYELQTEIEGNIIKEIEENGTR